MTTTTRPTRRPRQPLPDFSAEALAAAGLEGAYAARPPYQRNDYLGWITRAKLPATRQKRLDQMLAELRAGDRLATMLHSGGRQQDEG